MAGKAIIYYTHLKPQGTLCYIADMPELLQYPSLEEQTLIPQIEQSRFPEGTLFQPEYDEVVQAAPSEQRNAVLSEPGSANAIEQPPQPETSTLRQRLTSRVGQAVVRGLMCLGLASGGVAVATAPAHAESGHTYTIENTDGDGVWLHGDPGLGDPGDLIAVVPEGTSVTADCYVNDTPIGNKNNPAWLRIIYKGEQGFISDAFTSSRWSRSNTLHDQGLAFCGEEKPAPEQEQPPEDTTDVKSCYFNLKAPSKNLTLSYSGDHRYYGNAWRAAKNWTDAGAGIKITATKENIDAYIRIKEVDIDRHTEVEGLDMNEGTAGAVVIPRTKEWMGPHTSVPEDPHTPESLTLLINRHAMDQLNDFQRTYAFTHEIGHTLGFAHTNGPAGCGIDDKSIMNQGSATDGILQRKFNTPMPFDKAELKQLYS